MSAQQQPPAPEAPVLKKQRRTLNRWSIIVLLVTSAALSVLYVNNVVRINELLSETELLERKRAAFVSANEALRIECVRLQSAERISRIAQEKLGMVQSREAPVVIEAEK